MGGGEGKKMEEKGWDRREGMGWKRREGWNGMGQDGMEEMELDEGMEWKGCYERDRMEQKRWKGRDGEGQKRQEGKESKGRVEGGKREEGKEAAVPGCAVEACGYLRQVPNLQVEADDEGVPADPQHQPHRVLSERASRSACDAAPAP